MIRRVGVQYIWVAHHRAPPTPVLPPTSVLTPRRLPGVFRANQTLHSFLLIRGGKQRSQQNSRQIFGVTRKSRNALTSLTQVGIGHSDTARIFSGSVVMPSPVRICPRNATSRWRTQYLLGFNFKPAICSRSNTCRSFSRCSSSV